MNEPEPYRYRRPEKKRCARCGEWLPFADFRPNPRNTYYRLHSWCRHCCAAYNREWRERNREQVDAYNEAYNASRSIPPAQLECVECGEPFEGRSDRLVCSRRCKDRRYARHHPEQVREKNRRHQANRRARAQMTRIERLTTTVVSQRGPHSSAEPRLSPRS